SFCGDCCSGSARGSGNGPAVLTEAAPTAFRLGPEFWTVRTMALLSAVLFGAYWAFGARAESNGERGLLPILASSATSSQNGAFPVRFSWHDCRVPAARAPQGRLSSFQPCRYLLRLTTFSREGLT